MSEHAELTWSAFAIPDSSPDIALARLRVDDHGAFTALVRFPAGWERPVTGSYDAAEEALVLDGELTMSGRQHGRGDFARWGVGYERAGTSTPDGALVLAWFSGPNRWTPGPTGATALDVDIAWTEAPTADLGPAGTPHVLSDRDDVSVVVWDELPRCVAPIEIELFAIEPRVFTHVPAGQELPTLEGPVLGRVRGPVHQLS